MSKNEVIAIQEALSSRGFNPGPIDGILGPKTRSAIVKFKRSIGLRARPYIGPITRGALLDDRSPAPQISTKEPIWFRNARSYLGLREYPGKRSNSKILNWWKLIRAKYRDDETPWCAAFVGGTLEEVLIRSTRSAAARSYDKWGVKLKQPSLGCVVTFWRGSPKSWKGHVGYVVGRDQDGRLMVLGGNQGDSVSIKAFSDSRIIGFYWPSNVKEQPSNKLPCILSDGTISSNEA